MADPQAPNTRGHLKDYFLLLNGKPRRNNHKTTITTAPTPTATPTQTQPTEANIEANNEANLETAVQATMAEIDANLDPNLANFDTRFDADFQPNFESSLESSFESNNTSSQSSIGPSDSLSQTIPITTPAKLRSWVYQHFESTQLQGDLYTPKYSDKQKVNVRRRCKVCNWITYDFNRSGTSNLISHLRTHRLTRTSSKPEPSIIALLQAAPPKDDITVEEAICNWVVDTLQPFTVVETASFQRIFKARGLPLTLQSADTLRRRIFDQFKTSRSVLISQLDQTCNTVSLTLDVWTSGNNVPIFGVVGHWITPDFVYQQQLLEFCEIKGNCNTLLYKFIH